MKLYDQMLLIIFEGIVVPITSLRCLFTSDSTMYKYIDRAFMDRHVKEQNFEFQSKNNERTIKCLVLTNTGLKYLHTNCRYYFHGAEKELIENSTPYGEENTNTAQKSNYANTAYAATVSLAAGAKCSYPLTDRYDGMDIFFQNSFIKTKREKKIDSSEGSTEDRLSYKVLQRKIAYNEKKRRQGEERQNLNGYPFSEHDDTFIAYLGRRSLKSAAQIIYANDYNVHDFDRCRNSGLLQSHYRSVLLFTNFACGFRWQDSFISADIALYQNWRRALSDEFRISSIPNKECAALIVDNPRHFGSIYHDAAKVRRGQFTSSGAKRLNFDVIGKGFEHFYAVPTVPRGAAMLNRLMLANDKDEKAEIIKKLKLKHGFIENEKGNTELYPVAKLIHNGEAIQYALCTDLDIKTLQRIEKDMADGKAVRGVVCEKWQIPYIKTVLGKKVIIYMLPNNGSKELVPIVINDTLARDDIDLVWDDDYILDTDEDLLNEFDEYNFEDADDEEIESEATEE